MTLNLTSENRVDSIAPRHCRCSINVWVNVDSSSAPTRQTGRMPAVYKEGPIAASGNEVGDSLPWLVVATSLTSGETF